ncbi:MAG: YwaF family protein [Saccharofermentanales bacterium]
MDIEEIFSKSPQIIQPFTLFSRQHLMALLTIATFITVMTLLARKYEKVRKSYKWFLLIAIPVQEIGYKIWAGFIGGIDLEIVFSLHLCSAAVIILVILLIRYQQNLFEIVYFWGLGGATQALLTPDISATGFPHFRFFQVFFSHGMIVATVLFFIFAERRKLRAGSLKRVIIITNLYALAIFAVNSISGTNYLFINHTPETASLLDSLGAWPIYLIWLEVLLLVIFSLLYLPVYIGGRQRRQGAAISGSAAVAEPAE